jgi:hypothetical protein
MSRKAKSTGLGTAAFFSGKAGAATGDGLAVEAKKMRTTIMLSPDVVAGIEALRMQSRKQGTRLTTSRIIEDALRLLLRERKISV